MTGSGGRRGLAGPVVRRVRGGLRATADRVYADFLMAPRIPAYRRLLESIRASGYRVVSLERLWGETSGGTRKPRGRLLVLRHDIDTDPDTAWEMWQVDQELGIESTYFFRLSTLDIDLMRAIASSGSHASYHFEELATIAKSRGARTAVEAVALLPAARALFARNVDTIRLATGLSIRIVASHGDFANRVLGSTNSSILEDRTVRTQVGIDLEAYDDALLRLLDVRISDGHDPRHWQPVDPAVAIAAGARVVQVLVHPRHWRARPMLNLREDLGRTAEGVAYAFRVPLRRWTASTQPSPAIQRPAATADCPPPHPVDERPGISAPRPRLLVQVPDTYRAERAYVVDVVLREWLKLEYDLVVGGSGGTRISVQGDERERSIRIADALFATPTGDWLSERAMPKHPLEWLTRGEARSATHAGGRAQRSGDALPILFGPASRRLDAESVPHAIDLPVDVLGSVFFLLSGYEEVVRPERDAHGRFPAAASFGVVEGLIDRPLADEYVGLLRQSIASHWPGLEPRSPALRLRLTHDVDELRAGYGLPLRRVARTAGGDIIHRHDPALAARRTVACLQGLAGRPDADPFNTFDFLMDTSERHGLRSTFFILAGSSGHPLDGQYELTSPAALRLLRRIHDRGHEVGLHASYSSYVSAAVIKAEFAALRAACRLAGFDQPRWGVRQHYLRVANPTTWTCQEAAGLDYDSSVGYAERPGFRAGTCREFPLFDLRGRRTLGLREQPMLVMDRTFLGYLPLPAASAHRHTLALVDACQPYGGDPVLLVHNNLLVGPGRARYAALVRDLTERASAG